MDSRAAAVAVLSASLAWAAPPPLGPLPPRSPETLAPPSLRVHVRLHEDLEPDRLRAFARPRVTLWLDTRSNVLKASTLEHLSRFDQVYVHLRPPVTESQVRALEAAPRAGVWIEAAAVEGKGLARLVGPRFLAVVVKGAVDEALFERVARLKPEIVEWVAPADAEVMAWSLFRQLPGRKFVTLEPGGLPPRACSGTDSGPAARVHLASLLALGANAFPCGRGPRVVMASDTDRWLIQSVVVRDPTAELEIEVGADDAAAKQALQLLDELGLPPHR